MSPALVDHLVERAMELAIETDDDDEAAIADLTDLAGQDDRALEQAMRTCLAQPVSLAIRHRAIELLARVRYEDPSALA